VPTLSSSTTEAVIPPECWYPSTRLQGVTIQHSKSTDPMLRKPQIFIEKTNYCTPNMISVRPCHIQAVSRRLSTAAARIRAGSVHVEFVVDKVALGQVFSEYFGFPCNFPFHQLLHNLYVSSEAGTISQTVVAVPNGLCLTP
jgi:hypothetical protein